MRTIAFRGRSVYNCYRGVRRIIVTMRCRGINQRREVVIEFKRTFMVYKRGAPEVTDMFPATDEDWTV